MEKRVVKGRVWASVSLANGDTSEMEETDLEVGVFETQPAKVTVSLGKTINLGNYESARVDVGVELPCYVEEVEEAQRAAYRIAKKALKGVIADAKK